MTMADKNMFENHDGTREISYMPVQMLPLRVEQEIPVKELLTMLLRQKWSMLAILVVCIAMALGYLFITRPVYTSTAYLLPPRSQDIEELNILDTLAPETPPSPMFTPAKVYEYFLTNLRSRGVKDAFYREKDIALVLKKEAPKDISPARLFEEYFLEKTSLTKAGTDKPKDFYALSMNGHNATQITEWVNELVHFASQQSVQQLIADVRKRIEAEQNSLRHQINGQKAFARQTRNDRVVQLQEALRIAHKLNIQTNQLTKTSVSQTNDPDEGFLYMQGVDSLQTQIEVLLSRKSDDAFAPKLRELEENLEVLDSISFNPDTLKVARIDMEAVVPEEPVRPNPPLVLLVAAMLGMIIGLAWGLFRSLIVLKKT
jgi:chain length determinant protein (polysaccharide antigen chain regulator)